MSSVQNVALENRPSETEGITKESEAFRALEKMLTEDNNPGARKYVDFDLNGLVAFKIQNGNTDVFGTNGCQIDFVVEFVREFLAVCNKYLPSRETSCAITKIDEALHWLDARTKDRTSRNVEGTKAA